MEEVPTSDGLLDKCQEHCQLRLRVWGYGHPPWRLSIFPIISKYSLDFKGVAKEYADEYGIEQIEGSLLIDEALYAKAIAAALDVKEKVIEKIRKLL